MAQRQAKAPAGWRALGRFLLRLLVVLGLALALGTVLNRTFGQLEADPAQRPAGFARGVAQGALMPLALPNLLVGRDVAIYASHNTGRTYKLGYTVGVNGCGAIFFGLLFWRITRLRRKLAQAGQGGEGHPIDDVRPSQMTRPNVSPSP